MTSNNTATAMAFFTSRGYSKAQAAGIVVNLLGESNPTVGFLNDAVTLPHIARRFLEGQRTEVDARKAFSLLYLQNNLLVANIFGLLVSPLPDRR